MLRFLFISIFIFHRLVSLAQVPANLLGNDSGVYNLGFENINNKNKTAEGWSIGTPGSGYKVKIDSIEKHSGRYSLLIEKVDKEIKSLYDLSTYIIPAQYEGKEIEIKFFLKLENVHEKADFMLRIDGDNPDQLQLVRLLSSRVHGTQKWREYKIKLPLPAEASKIFLSPILYGVGKLWIDDIQVRIDGRAISKAKLKQKHDLIPIRKISYGENASVSGKVKVENGMLYYEIYGEGKPLLLLHGNSQSISVFKKQIQEFSKFYKVITVDTRGHGKSIDLSTTALSYDLYAKDMRTLLDSLHITKTNILGWSDGGNTGLIMAFKYPDYVDSWQL